MSKVEFLQHLRTVYAAANHPAESWMTKDMKYALFCQPINDILNDMFDAGVLTQEDLDDFFADL